MRKHIRIGDLLVDNGIITLAQLEDALKSQKGTDKKLGQVLIEQGMITKKQIMKCGP